MNKKALKIGAVLAATTAVALFAWRTAPESDASVADAATTAASPGGLVGPPVNAPSPVAAQVGAEVEEGNRRDSGDRGYASFARGVHLVPIEQQDISADAKEGLRGSLANLRSAGSMSGGRMTHEFMRTQMMADSLRKYGIEKLHAMLAIQPSSLQLPELGGKYTLIGADVQGKDVKGMGRSGFFQVLRSPATGEMVELSEWQYDVLSGDGAIISPEFYNDSVGVHSATIEELRDSRGAPIVNVQWHVGHRGFFLTTSGISRDAARALAEGVTARFEAMQFDGWRRAYDYDPNNPMHRVARGGGPSSPPTR